MAERILLEEYHLTILVSDRTPDADREAVRRVLTSRRFRAALRRAVAGVIDELPPLARVRWTLTN